MKIIKFFVALVLTLTFAQASSAAPAQDAVAQPTLSDLIATARQTLALKAMTVPQLLTRVQLPAISWYERHQIVDELRVRPALEVLPLLYHILTARGPYNGFNNWGGDPYEMENLSGDEQVKYALDRAWEYEVGAKGDTDLDKAYYVLAEQPYSDEKAKKLDELKKKREKDHEKRHQEVGHILLDILRKYKVNSQTVRIMYGFSDGYSWIKEAQPDVIAICGDAKTDSGTRWWALNTLMQWSESDDYPAITQALHHLPLAEQLKCLNQLSYPMGLARQPLLGDSDTPDYYVLQFGFDLLKQAVATQGAPSENAVQTATALAKYAKINFAPNAPADLKLRPSEAEIQQHNQAIAAYNKTLVQPAFDWWQRNFAKYKAESETETIVFVPN